ncbi:hypothetical protein Dda_2491 [Drechslerella dactyloides]|uniref:C2H2-type domain-containing protein n=1 Tax=Drechslerella dactyloides TaxID=74499 RepID=A0AAD6IZL9_DREDA|nr:hypothetical protein Dda_2491 [Drechslerella dactyloides]
MASAKNLTDDERLEKVRALESQLTEDKAYAKNAATEIKSRLLVSSDWPDMLTNAPTAINLLGSCFVVSSSPFASTTNLSVEPEKVGLNALTVSESNFDGIGFASTRTQTKCMALLKCLQSPKDTAKTSTRYLNQIKEAADESYRLAKEVDDGFQTWLDYICAFHAACEETGTETGQKVAQNKTDVIERTVRLQGQEELVAQQQEQTKVIEDTLKDASKTFKAASKGFPSGWSLVGQDSVRILASTIPTAVNTAVTVGINSATGGPIGGLGALGMEAVNGVTHVVGQGMSMVQQEMESKKEPPTIPRFVILMPQVMAALNPLKATLDSTINWDTINQNSVLRMSIELLEATKDSLDTELRRKEQKKQLPALDEHLKLIVNASLKIAKSLQTEGASESEEPSKDATANNTTGKTDEKQGPGKDTAATTDNKKVPIATNNATTKPDEKKEPAKDAAGKPDEKTMSTKDASAASTDKTTDPTNAAAGESDDAKKKREALAEKLKKDFETQYLDAVRLQAASGTIPGNTMGLMPTIGGPTPQITKEQVDTNKMLLQNATDRLNIAQKSLNNSQVEYNKSTKELAESTKMLIEIKAALAQLESEEITLAEVQSVLIACVGIIATMTTAVRKVGRFFKSISDTVGLIVKNVVKEFLQSSKDAEAEKAGVTADDMKQYQVAGFTFEETVRTGLHEGIVSIMGYYGLFGDIATMWVGLSRDHLSPGIDMATELSKLAGPPDLSHPVTHDAQQAIADKNKVLNEWTTRATDAVQKIVGDAQKKAVENINSRTKEIAEVASFLVPTQAHVEAIETGAKLREITSAAAVNAAKPVTDLKALEAALNSALWDCHGSSDPAGSLHLTGYAYNWDDSSASPETSAIPQHIQVSIASSSYSSTSRATDAVRSPAGRPLMHFEQGASHQSPDIHAHYPALDPFWQPPVVASTKSTSTHVMHGTQVEAPAASEGYLDEKPALPSHLISPRRRWHRVLSWLINARATDARQATSRDIGSIPLEPNPSATCGVSPEAQHNENDVDSSQRCPEGTPAPEEKGKQVAQRRKVTRKSQDEEERCFVCDFDRCNKSFKDSAGLRSERDRKHKYIHNQRAYSCDDCPKKFHASRDLRRHLEACHTGGTGPITRRPRYFCKYPGCGRDSEHPFSRRDNARQHIKEVHHILGKNIEELLESGSDEKVKEHEVVMETTLETAHLNLQAREVSTPEGFSKSLVEGAKPTMVPTRGNIAETLPPESHDQRPLNSNPEDTLPNQITEKEMFREFTNQSDSEEEDPFGPVKCQSAENLSLSEFLFPMSSSKAVSIDFQPEFFVEDDAMSINSVVGHSVRWIHSHASSRSRGRLPSTITMCRSADDADYEPYAQQAYNASIRQKPVPSRETEAPANTDPMTSHYFPGLPTPAEHKFEASSLWHDRRAGFGGSSCPIAGIPETSALTMQACSFKSDDETVGPAQVPAIAPISSGLFSRARARGRHLLNLETEEPSDPLSQALSPLGKHPGRAKEFTVYQCDAEQEHPAMASTSNLPPYDLVLEMQGLKLESRLD